MHRFIVAILALAAGASLLGGGGSRVGTDDSLPRFDPILPRPESFEVGETWHTRRVGDRDFYFAEAGPYYWYTDERIAMLRQVGLFDRMIPGHANLPKRLESFAPATRKTLTRNQRQLVDAYLENRWPVLSLEYVTLQGNPPPSQAAIDALGDLWVGDGGPERVYRLEPVFHFVKTGKKWNGSSQYLWNDDAARDFMQRRLFPLLDREMPFFRDTTHTWSHAELRRLSDIYNEEWYRPVGRAVAWGTQLAPYHMASLPSTIAVGDKGSDPRKNARTRGAMRQSGGDKFWLVWQGHEPTERWAYFDRAWMATQKRDEWGYPLELLPYYFFRPYLVGANYFHLEGSPESLIRDVEGDGQYELTPLGHIATDMLDFVDRHPDRGVPYTPIGLLLDYDRQLPNDARPGTTYLGYDLPFDAGDHMTAGVLDLLFPEHPQRRFAGGKSYTAPYGELFDILTPNRPDPPIAPKVFEPYKVLFALGGLRVDSSLASVLMDYVEAGGALVANVSDLGELPVDFFGVSIAKGSDRANRVVNTIDGRTFDERPFQLARVSLRGAEALYTSGGRPVLTRHQVGRGFAFLVAAEHMIAEDTEPRTLGRAHRTYPARPLVAFAGDFFDHLTESVSPVSFLRRDADRPNLSFTLAHKGDGWVVAVFNDSLDRDLEVSTQGSSKVIVDEPLRALPFEIAAHTKVTDALEWYSDRNVRWALRDGEPTITESIRGGEIRVYELQPRRITLAPRTRPMNYARGASVTVSSSDAKSSPEAAIDGDRDNERFWQSGRDKSGHHYPVPQWLRLDLGQVRTLDQAFVQFHTWPHQSLDTRLRVLKWRLEASRNGRSWVTVIDESRNEDPADLHGLRRWFDPVEARYVRLTVDRNSAFSGAQVVEIEVQGPELETWQPERAPAPAG